MKKEKKAPTPKPLLLLHKPQNPSTLPSKEASIRPCLSTKNSTNLGEKQTLQNDAPPPASNESCKESREVRNKESEQKEKDHRINPLSPSFASSKEAVLLLFFEPEQQSFLASSLPSISFLAPSLPSLPERFLLEAQTCLLVKRASLVLVSEKEPHPRDPAFLERLFLFSPLLALWKPASSFLFASPSPSKLLLEGELSHLASWLKTLFLCLESPLSLSSKRE